MCWRRQWHPTPVLLPGKSHGRRSLVGCSPWGRWESDMTERLHFHFSLSCIGEGTGNPLQCSCLENPRDWGAWWAAVYGVAQSRTRLKQLSSSSRSLTFNVIKVAEFWSTILLLSVHFLWSTFLMLSGLFENLFSVPLCFTYWPLLRPYLYFLMITLRIFIYIPILCLFR